MDILAVVGHASARTVMSIYIRGHGPFLQDPRHRAGHLRDESTGDLLRDGTQVDSPSGSLAWLTRLTWKADKPEPEIDEPVGRVVPEAEGRPAVLGGEAPRAAAKDTVRVAL